MHIYLFIYIFFSSRTFNSLFQKTFKQTRVEDMEVPRLLKKLIVEIPGTTVSFQIFRKWTD